MTYAMALFMNELYPISSWSAYIVFAVLLRKAQIPGMRSTSHGITYPENYILYQRVGVLVPLSCSQRQVSSPKLCLLSGE